MENVFKKCIKQKKKNQKRKRKQLIKIKQKLLFMTRFFVIKLLVYINFSHGFKIIISISDY